MSTELTSGEVIGALNAFRDLMKVCFINGDIPTRALSDSTINLYITPTITIDNDEVTNKNLLDTDIGSTFKDIKNLNDFLTIIKISGNSLSTYMPLATFSISNIRTIIGSSDLVIEEYKDYLAYLIYFYYYLIILCGIGCIEGISTEPPTSTPSKKLYNSYILHMQNYIDGIRSIDNTAPINNYLANKEKVTKTSDDFIEQKKDNKKILTEIEAYDGYLSYVYLYIYFIITLLLVIVIFCIVFKDNNSYLIGILVLLIIINALFSKYIVIIEEFNTYAESAIISVYENKCDEKHLNSPASRSSNYDIMKNHLCKAFNVTYDRLRDDRLHFIRDASWGLMTENNLYKKLYTKVKSLNFNTTDTINLNLLSFYQRKEYVNLFMRIIILAILLLILYNIFGFHYIIVILGIVLFSLIFMVYLYGMKKISRTNYKNINWNHKFNYN